MPIETNVRLVIPTKGDTTAMRVEVHTGLAYFYIALEPTPSVDWMGMFQEQLLAGEDVPKALKLVPVPAGQLRLAWSCPQSNAPTVWSAVAALVANTNKEAVTKNEEKKVVSQRILEQRAEAERLAADLHDQLFKEKT